MAQDKLNDKINDLFERCKWPEARAVLEKERERNPDDHWLITQLGVTYYEEFRYEEALKCLLASQQIVKDCPLTIWNLAGTIDALSKHRDAIPLYTWLLECKKSPTDDPCWESEEWADVLKADCVYRIGVCFEQLGENEPANDCFRQYLKLLVIGIDGTYSMSDVQQKLRTLQPSGKHASAEIEMRNAANLTRKAAGIERKRAGSDFPNLNLKGLLAKRRVASKT